MGSACRNSMRKPENPRCLIVVRQDEPELCQYLRDIAGGGEVKVFLDRRQNDAFAAEGLECDRRRPASVEKDLRSRQYIIVSPQRGISEC